MLFEVIGAEWAHGLAVDEPAVDPGAEQFLREVRASASPEQLASYLGSRTDELPGYRANLVAHARAEVLAGRRDVEPVGRVLLAIGHLGADVRAAGHFLVGYALRSRSDQSRRHFELAAVAYRDLGAVPQAALAALAAEALDAERMRDGVAVDGLLRAVAAVGRADTACGERLTAPVERYVGLLRLAHELKAGGPVPSTTFAASEDELAILRAAMVGALARPERAAAIARWIQTLCGLRADDTQELDQLSEMLAHVRAWELQLELLRDMIAHGDRRPATLTRRSRALTELGRWDEAKAELKAGLGDRPGSERLELLRFLVMTGHTVGDPETPEWIRMLEAMGSGLAESATPPPTQAAEEEQARQPRRRLRARFENGGLSVDPAIPPEEFEEHMLAAMILGLGEQEGAQLRDEIAAKDPALYEKVLEYLPAYARPASDAEAHLAAAEQLFRGRRYREAVAEYQAALAADPDLEYAQLGLGDAYYMLGEYRMAIAHFTESIAIRPTPQALRFLGDAILHGQLDPHRAKQCYEQALELDPEYGGARAALRQVTQMLADGGADGR